MKILHCVAVLLVLAGVVSVTNLFVASLGEEDSLFQQYHNLNSIFAENDRRIALERGLVEAKRRFREKERVARSLATSQITLFETVSLFTRLDEAKPGAKWECCKFPGTSQEEKYCRQVIHWMVQRAILEQSDEESNQLRQRLEAELQEHLERNGGVVKLPDYVDLEKWE